MADAADLGEQPWSPAVVKRLIRQLLEEGVVIWTDHATDEMRKDKLDMLDCVNVVRGGAVAPGEWENGAWRYRVSTTRICVVVEFPEPTELVVVTAWRIGR
jgi:hypothetical protein